MAEAFIGLAGVVVGSVLMLTAQCWIARQRLRNQFRLAALDKRLEKHQEAFALWQSLVSAVHRPEERTKVVLQCQDWWYNNCLYLSPKAREAFRRAYMAAWEYNPKVAEMREKEWPRIMDPGRVIPAAVDLPPVGDVKPIGIDGKKTHT